VKPGDFFGTGGNGHASCQFSFGHDLYRWVHLDELDEGEYPEWMKEEIRRAYRIYTDFRGL